MKYKIILLVFLIIAVAIILYLTKFNENNSIIDSVINKIYVTQEQKDARCLKKPEFTGLCLMFITTIQYDQWSNSCVALNGGGCGVTGGFISKLECESLCVDNWQTKSAYDKIIFSKGIKTNDRYFTFDLEGRAKLESEAEVYVLLDAVELNSGNIKALAIVEKVAEYKTEHSASALYLGSFILPFELDSSGYLVSNEKPIPLDIPGIRPKKVELKILNMNKVEISYEIVPCGSENEPKCFTRKIKIYDIQSRKVTDL